MEGLGAAANVIAVVDLCAKVASFCYQYSLAVKHAKNDITRLQGELKSLRDMLGEVQQLLDGPDSAKLSTSQKLLEALKDGFSQLKTLDGRLNPGKARKAMSRMGVRALKWPFESKEVDKVVYALEKCKQTVSLALQIDQTALILNISETINLTKLPSAEGAAFNSHLDELDARCHPDTRVDLRRQIREWARNPQGKCIFWLSGMAGTGKSTISRTVAQSFADEGQLGASFFFKRGEGDRGNATKFFTTITAQLIVKVPALIPHVRKAIDIDPAISGKAMKEQFEKLILQPFSETKHISPQISKLVIVVDALDECEREGDIKNILFLLSQTRHVRSLSLRIFVTSRPELPIRLGFMDMSKGTYQDLVLHEIPQPMIEHDISAFLKAELAKVRKDHNHLHPSDRWLPPDWPGERNIQALVNMAIPLFIFGTTVCRFIGDLRWDPEERLATVLRYQTAGQASRLDRTYLPVLDQLLVGLTDSDREILTGEFREVVGSIITLAEPLSTISLASLLSIPKKVVDCRLNTLHSVLSVPANQDSPVRLLHLSFRDFLIDAEKRGRSLFWVDEGETHKMIATKCLELMSKPGCLRENICSLETPGKQRTEIDYQVINDSLSADVRYACRYWVHHLERSKSRIHDQSRVHSFLQKHFLHWLEALSLMGKMSESIGLVGSLQSIIAVGESTQISEFLYDARRFILKYRWIIDTVPLQLYSSAIVFAPETSIIRKTYKDRIPSWIRMLPQVESAWSAELEMLEGHTAWVGAVAFSPSGELLASASDDCTVRLWDTATGVTLQTLEGHTNSVRAVVFSPDGKLLASASHDHTVRLWDTATGATLWDAAAGGTLQTPEGPIRYVSAVAFSPDGKLLASASDDCTARLWDTATGATLQTLEGHTDYVRAVAFFPDGKLLASASHDRTVRLWDTATGATLQTLEGHTDQGNTVTFSPDGKLLASASGNGTVRLWDTATGATPQMLEGHTNYVNDVAFSPDGRLLASASGDRTVRLWDTATGAALQTLEDIDFVRAMTFSPDGKLLASALEDCTVRLWDTATRTVLQPLEDTGSVNAMAFSPDGKLLASASHDGAVRLWDMAMGAALQTREGHTNRVSAVAFSPDGKLLASASADRTVRLWNTATGATLQTLEGHTDYVRVVAFSPDGKLLASASHDRTVRLWDTATGAAPQTLEGHTDWVSDVAFSPDGKLLASASRDLTVRLWDTATGAALQTLEGHTNLVSAIAFSPDGKLLASASRDHMVRLWDTATGAALQTLEGYTATVHAVTFSPDGKLLASALGDRTVRLWDTATRAALQTLEGHTDWVSAVAFSPDGELLASASGDRTVRLWDTATGAALQTLEDYESIRKLSFSSDGRYLETNRGLLYLWSSLVHAPLGAQHFYAMFANANWVTQDGENLLWLPSNSRGTCSAFRRNLLVLGRASGRVMFIAFSFS